MGLRCLEIFFVLFVAAVPFAVGVGMPAPNFYSSSFATALWNATQAKARNATHHARQRAEYRLRQLRDKCNAHHAQHQFHHANGHNATYGYDSQENVKNVQEETTTSSIMHKGQDQNETMLLTEYISKLEERLASIEQTQEDFNTTLSIKEPPMLLEGLRLMFVSALPMLTYGAVVGLALFLIMHILTWLMDQWVPISNQIVRPVCNQIVLKVQWLVILVAKFVVNLLGGPSTPPPPSATMAGEKEATMPPSLEGASFSIPVPHSHE